PATNLAQTPPTRMVRIPEGQYDFQVRGTEIEGGNDPSVDVQYPWEDAPRRVHRHQIHIASFFIDRTPVTNAEFKRFLAATSYRPKDDHNFLRDWKNGGYSAGWDKKPVTWVSIDDARAYAKWAGKRLPHAWELQYAAQSSDGRRSPCVKDCRSQAAPPRQRPPHTRP